MRRNAATILLFAALAAMAAAAFIVLTGGAAGPLLTLRDPWRPAVAGLVLLSSAWACALPDDRAIVFRPYLGAHGARAARGAMLLSGAVLVFAIAWSSRAAGGSDSSCYVLQAEAFAHGHATLANPVAAVLPGMPNAVFAPAGFVPSPGAYGEAVPICAPGLALAMAAAYLVRPTAVFLVVPLSAGWLVWLTFVYGRRLDGEVTGLCAAVLLACSPIFLYQAVQPMSDVPAAAAWMAALVAPSPIAAGVWASLAILIRPNLALLVLPLALLRGKRGQPPFSKRGQPAFLTPETAPAAEKGGSPLFVALVPGALVLLALNAARYGSPFATGYGSTEALFTRAHVDANLLRYPRWLIETQTPILLLALAAPWPLRRDAARARLAWVSLAAIALLAATYLAYTVFDDWWYIRFLLPALPMAIGLSVAVLRIAARRLPPSARGAAVAIIVLLVCGFGVRVAQERHVTELQALESRFRLTGEYAGRVLPDDAIVLTVQESGSVRFHGRRETLAWDAIPGDALDAVIARLQSGGHQVYLALEDAEEPAFRRRFGTQRTAVVLEAPPASTIRAATRVRIYCFSCA